MTKKLSFLLFLLGIIEFIPFPNAPAVFSACIQNCNPLFITVVAIFLEIGLLFYSKKNYVLIYIFILVGAFLFRGPIIHTSNQLIVMLSDNEQEESMNLFLGVIRESNENYSVYSWFPFMDSYCNLIFAPNHGLESNADGPEIRKVYNEHWYVDYKPLLE